MFVDATNICRDVQILNILTIFKSIIKFACIIVPVILVLFIIIDVVKTISSGDVDTKKLFKSISKRIIAAVVVFLIPFLINFVIGVIPTGKFYYRDCYDAADKQNLERIAVENFNNSYEKLRTSLTNCNSKKSQCYSDSYLNYEQARKDLKLIPKGNEKERADNKLKEQKKVLNSIQ